MAIQINSFSPDSTNAFAINGGTATFSVNATETNDVQLLYQWQRKGP